MNSTIVPFSPKIATREQVLARVAQALPGMSPQLKQAAQYVLDNPDDIGFSSVREIAAQAQVKPNTLVRLGRALGFQGFEDFREPFREALKRNQTSFPDRARWLQSLARGGRLGGLFSDMAASTMENVEALFSNCKARDIKRAADKIVKADTTYVLGVGISYAMMHNFAYLARMALNSVVAAPQDGSLPIDDIARANSKDLLFAMTFTPCRTEVIDAVTCAKDQGVYILGITDSHASPLALKADQCFVIPTETPQFFTSMVAASALLETLMAFVVADADDHVIENIERFHKRRHELGVYHNES